MAHTERDAGPRDPEIKHETTDANLGGVERLVVVTGVFLALVFALIWVVYGQLLKREVRNDTPPPPIAQRRGDRLPPLPRLQQTPRPDLAQFRAAEEAALNAYAWVDKPAGIVQVPVARAIDLIVEHGMPKRPTMAPAAAPGAPAGTPAAVPGTGH
jgi:hypothetical protein